MALVFTNYKKQRDVLGETTHEHIMEMHPEVTLDHIKFALEDPNEVRRSSYRENSELYYLRRTRRRFTCVIVKICSDGNYISTALTTEKPKVGGVIFKKGE